MAKIEITVPGERIVEDFTALVPQPTSPSTARAPDVGLVELSYVNPTNLIPGPPGPPGPAGTRWYTGVGDPTITGAKLGDYYLDDVTGYIWTWNGTAWVMTGTDLSPDAGELLAKIITVDGAGSGLDADTLDGQDGAYYLDWDNFVDKPSTFPPTLPIPSSGVIGLDAEQDAQDAAIAAISEFPEAPVDGLTYGRKNANWATIVGGAVVSDSAPGAPLQNGQLWFKSNSGDTFIWVDDGNSQQWVQQNILPPMTIPSNYITATAEPRNRLVNGAMQFSQEWGTASLSALGGYYPADQWMFSHPGPQGYWTYQQVQSPTPKGSQYRIRMNCVTPKGALAATDYVTLRQYIEGVRVVDFGWGTAAAKPIVIRFGFKGPAGTYSVNTFNSPLGNRTYIAQFTISAAQANTDTEQIVAIPGDTTGTWTTGNVASIALLFTLAAGSNYVGSLGWNASGAIIAAGNSNGWAAAGVFEIFDVGLYRDPLNTGVPPEWALPDEPEELRLCQRYFQKVVTGQYYMGGLGSTVTLMYYSWDYRTDMRTTPTLSGVTTVSACLNNVGANSNSTTATTTPLAQRLRLEVSLTPGGLTGLNPQTISCYARM